MQIKKSERFKRVIVAPLENRVDHMLLRAITFWRVNVTALTTTLSTIGILIEIVLSNVFYRRNKSHFRGTYGIQNLAFV